MASWFSRRCKASSGDARRCRAPHHEGPRPHPEEPDSKCSPWIRAVSPSLRGAPATKQSMLPSLSIEPTETPRRSVTAIMWKSHLKRLAGAAESVESSAQPGESVPDGQISSNSARDRCFRRPQIPQNHVRAKTNFASRFNVIWPVQSPRKKYFASVFQKSVSCFSPSRPDRGAFRDRHERWVGCGGRDDVVHA
jgi:hypothetical protein